MCDWFECGDDCRFLFISPVIDGIANTFQKSVADPANAAAIIHDGLEVLLAGLAGMACVFLAGILATYFQQRIMIGVSQRALKSIRKDLFDHIQKLPIKYFDTNATGDIMSRFTNDVDTIGEMLNSTIIQLISGAISVIGTVAVMLYMNIWLALLTIVMVPLMIKAGGFIAKKAQNITVTSSRRWEN